MQDSQTQFKNAEQRFIIFLQDVIATIIKPLQSSHIHCKFNISKKQMSQLKIIFAAISNLYQFHLISFNQYTTSTMFQYYALFPSIYKKYFDSLIPSLPYLSNIFCMSKTNINIKKWFTSKCNTIKCLYDTTNTISYQSFAQILRDIFIHCIQQSNKLKKIATSEDFKTNMDAKSFKKQTRMHLKNTLLQKWENEYRQQFDVLHLEMILTHNHTNIQLYNQQRRLIQKFEVQIIKSPSTTNLFGLNKNKNKNNTTRVRDGILYIFNDCVLITTKGDKYKGLYDFNDKILFNKKCITFSRADNDKKKLTIVLGKTECKIAFETINDYKNQLKHNLSSASQSFSATYNDESETVNNEYTESNTTIITPLSYKDNIPIYDEDDILNKDFLMEQNINNDTDCSEEDHDNNYNNQLDEYYAAQQEILNDITYSQNMHIHNLFSKDMDTKQNKMLKHPFEMFLDNVNQLKQNENNINDIYDKSDDESDDELKPELAHMISLSTLGPSASVLMGNNLTPDDNYNINGNDFSWKVAPPTQSILDQFNLQTNNNLLLKEIKRLREIIAQNDQEMKNVKEENNVLTDENSRLKMNNDRLNIIVNKYKKKSFSNRVRGPVTEMNWSKSVDTISKNVKLRKQNSKVIQQKSHSFAVAQANRLRKRKRKSKKKVNRCFTSPISQPINSKFRIIPRSSQMIDGKAQSFDNMRSANQFIYDDDVSDISIKCSKSANIFQQMKVNYIIKQTKDIVL